LFSFAKIIAVADGERRAWPAARRAASFLRRGWRPALGLQVVCASAGLGLLALHYLLDPGAGQSGAWDVAGLLVFGQAFLIARLALRLTALAAQADLYVNQFRARGPRPE
ncbi:MAG: hypothetical protein ACRD0X_06980, partial [Thermoanaerobaculia bacterium]